MRRLIQQTFPAHGVVGEEYGSDRPDAEYVWVLDPIDGTKSFISGMPTWGTLIGLMHRGRPVYGMMAQPFTRERYYGDGKRSRLRTLAATRGDAPPSEWTTRSLRTRPCASLEEATLFTTSPLLIREEFGPESVPAGRKQGSAASLRRRLLRLLRACRRFRRPRHRDQPKAARHRRPHADHRGRRRRGHDLGRRRSDQGRAHSRRWRPAGPRRSAPSPSRLTPNRPRRDRTRRASGAGRGAARPATRGSPRQTRPRRPRARSRMHPPLRADERGRWRAMTPTARATNAAMLADRGPTRSIAARPIIGVVTASDRDMPSTSAVRAVRRRPCCRRLRSRRPSATWAARMRARRTLAGVGNGRRTVASVTPKARDEACTPAPARATAAASVAAAKSEAATPVAPKLDRRRKCGRAESASAISASQKADPAIPARTADAGVPAAQSRRLQCKEAGDRKDGGDEGRQRRRRGEIGRRGDNPCAEPNEAPGSLHDEARPRATTTANSAAPAAEHAITPASPPGVTLRTTAVETRISAESRLVPMKALRDADRDLKPGERGRRRGAPTRRFPR